MTVLTGVNCADIGNRHHDVVGTPIEPGLKTDEVVIQSQLIGGRDGRVQNDLAVSRITRRNNRAFVDRDRQIRGEPVIRAPFMNGADQVRLCRRLCHHDLTGA
jgi:hypothetical protein